MEHGHTSGQPSVKQEDADGPGGRYARLAALSFSAPELQRLIQKYLRPYIADHGRNTRRGGRLVPQSRAQQRYPTLAEQLQRLEASAASHQEQLLHALRCLELWEAQMGYTPMPAALNSILGAASSSGVGASAAATAADVVEVVGLASGDAEAIDIEEFVLDCVLMRIIKPDPAATTAAQQPPAVKPDPEVSRSGLKAKT